jgi:FtsH-binding integral membrane protein
MEINVSSNNQSGGVTAGQIVGAAAAPDTPKLPEAKPSFLRGVLSATATKLIATGVVAVLAALAAYLGFKP